GKAGTLAAGRLARWSGWLADGPSGRRAVPGLSRARAGTGVPLCPGSPRLGASAAWRGGRERPSADRWRWRRAQQRGAVDSAGGRTVGGDVVRSRIRASGQNPTSWKCERRKASPNRRSPVVSKFEAFGERERLGQFDGLPLPVAPLQFVGQPAEQ